jgi:hypothetical protein
MLMTIFGIDNSLDLFIVCVTIVAILLAIFDFFKWLLIKEDNYVDELISEEKYYEYNEEEPHFKRLYKRTYSSGKVDYITSED